MVPHKESEKQILPKEAEAAFKELKVLQHLRKADFKKISGFTCSYLFQIVFALVFYHKNWFQLLESGRGESFPGKDAIYRFLNHSKYAWRRFLLFFSAFVVQKVRRLTSSERVHVLMVDDSMYSRNRSKWVELLARCWDHAANCSYKGFRMLTLGWSDGHTFIPIDFALLSSIKSRINDISEKVDKRTSGYKRRLEALRPAPELIPEMIDRALDAGIQASYLLMDSWFTHASLIQEILKRGLHVIGMVKASKKLYHFGNRLLSLQELYYKATPVVSGKKNILRSIRVELVPGIPVIIVFVRHRSKKNAWIAILSTDCSLTVEQIIQTYAMRWNIEVFFKCIKSFLRLQNEFQGRSYDLLISHTTIVFTRYIVLAWQHRQNTDPRTFGWYFFIMCDEVSELDWATALRQLVSLIDDISQQTSEHIAKLIQNQLSQWMAHLPKYIRAYIPDLCCES